MKFQFERTQITTINDFSHVLGSFVLNLFVKGQLICLLQCQMPSCRGKAYQITFSKFFQAST